MPIATTSLHATPPADLRARLRARLLGLSYRAFLQSVIHLLHAQGYGHVRPAGRTHWKGRNGGGGWDAEAEVSIGKLTTLHCVAQVKQFDTLAVHQRQVDELRGSCLRAGAGQALLVTLSTFSPVARKAAEAGMHVAPVRLIDGDELLDLMVGSRIGVRRSRGGEWGLDETYFDELSRRFGETEHGQPTTTKAKSTFTSVSMPVGKGGLNPSAPSVMITLRLTPPSRATGRTQGSANDGRSHKHHDYPDQWS